MFTRCPDCQAVHPLNASLMALAHGAVRCGQCGCSYNALAFLFDHWPNSDTAPPRPGSGPPVLGQSPSPAAGMPPDGAAQQATGVSTPRRAGLTRGAWIAVFAVLLLATAANLAWTFREPLLRQPAVYDLLTRLGVVEPVVVEAYRDPSLIHLVSRDLHPHPARPELLVLSATFVNAADQAQPYPVMTLSLTDAANQPLARRSFAPDEYLPGGAPGELLAPQVHVPVLLEFVDPGERAVGFELVFSSE